MLFHKKLSTNLLLKKKTERERELNTARAHTEA